MDICNMSDASELLYESSWNDVIEDMRQREEFGYKKYGKYLYVKTNEDMLQHLYEELLDATVYIKTLINQRKI